MKIGIYFLIRNSKVVYVGQSRDIDRRIASHKLDKIFTSYRYILCDEDRLLHYEKRLIRLFRPELNGTPGGARDGAGRPKKEPTFTIRVPKALLPQINELIREYKNKSEIVRTGYI